MGGRPQPVNGHPGGNNRQGAKEELKIFIPGKESDPPLGKKSCQSGVAHNLQMMQLQMGYPQGANCPQGKQHILPALPRNSENQVGAKLKTTCCAYSKDRIFEIGKAVITVEKFQAPLMNALQAQLKKAFLAGFSHHFRQGQKEFLRHTIGPSGEYQTNTVAICQQLLKDRQQVLDRDGSAGFLLEIGKEFCEPAMEKMGLPCGKLIGNVTSDSQICRGKTGRTTEYAPAIKAIGAGLSEIEGNFTDPMAKFLPIMIAEGTKNRWSCI